MVLRSLALVAGLSALIVAISPLPADDDPPQEALAGFTMVTNGLISQEEFDANLKQFSEEAVEGPGAEGEEGGEGGLGPQYNAASCLNCHNNPAAGGSSQIAELRVGHLDGSIFSAPAGGTLIRQRAVRPEIQPKIPDGFEMRTRRMSTSLFGLGYIEDISDMAILNVQAAQPPEVRGTAILVDVTTGVGTTLTRLPQPLRTFVDSSTGTTRTVGGANGVTTSQRFGRFGWKCQHGSLVDFSADAQLNEKGLTSPLQPHETLAPDGRDLSQFDRKADPEDEAADGFPFGKDIAAYTRLMRSLRVPPRDHVLSVTAEAKAGEAKFSVIGCAVCHVQTWVTAPVGSTPRGSQAVPDALGNKIIHPFSDLMLHDIGTGESEVVQGGGPETRKMLRTALLWGLRTRTELMHDGLSYDLSSAIERHGGQAFASRAKYRALPAADKRALLTFLSSL